MSKNQTEPGYHWSKLYLGIKGGVKLPMRWTSEAPTQAGYYWFLEDGKTPEMVKVTQYGLVDRTKLYLSMEHLGGKWIGLSPEAAQKVHPGKYCGPLTPPAFNP